MRVLIINGPNLNMLGRRESEIYGSESFEPYFMRLAGLFPDLELRHVQSNSEGGVIDALQSALIGTAGELAHGVVLNAGAYSHYSYAIADAIKAIAPIPVVEVHISNPQSREEFRRRSVIAPVCRASVAGFGLHSYELAIRGLLHIMHA